MTGPLNAIARWLGRGLSRYLSQPLPTNGIAAPTDPATLAACLLPGDVLLVEGQTRVSVAIKYLTQSTWSHAALFVGGATGLLDDQGWPRAFIEADINEGVRAVSVQAFQSVRYPILPKVESVPSGDPACPDCRSEILQVRHHSLFVPRDFDVSPYFAVIKPTLATGSDHRALAWHDPARGSAGR